MCLALVLLAASALAPADLEVVPLRYRTADEVVPLVLPLLEGKGEVVGTGDQIFVRASALRRQELKAAIQALDRERQDVWISVRQLWQRRSAAQTARTDLGTPHFPGFFGTVQSVRVRAGTEAEVAVRRDTLSRKTPARLRVGGLEIVDDWYYETLGKDLTIVPRLMNDVVGLEIVTESATRDRQARVEHELRTSVSGVLGEWIDVGRVLEEHALRRSTPLDEDAREGRTLHTVLIKVERIP